MQPGIGDYVICLDFGYCFVEVIAENPASYECSRLPTAVAPGLPGPGPGEVGCAEQSRKCKANLPGLVCSDTDYTGCVISSQNLCEGRHSSGGTIQQTNTCMYTARANLRTSTSTWARASCFRSVSSTGFSARNTMRIRVWHSRYCRRQVVLSSSKVKVVRHGLPLYQFQDPRMQKGWVDRHKIESSCCERGSRRKPWKTQCIDNAPESISITGCTET